MVMARRMFSVHTPAARPNTTSFPISTASSSSSKEMIESTGPNTSSCAIRMSKTSQARPASRHACTASATIAIEASPGSVTRRGRSSPNSRQVCVSSRMRPGPKRIGVG